MPRLRLYAVWLLLLALPLQGFAAASMLFCGPAGPVPVAATSHAMHAVAGAAVADAPAHDHAAHASHTGQGDQGEAGGVMPDGDALSSTLPDTGHTCGVCAACCHVIALTSTRPVVASPLAPRADGIAPALPVAAFLLPVPDKPPRA